MAGAGLSVMLLLLDSIQDESAASASQEAAAMEICQPCLGPDVVKACVQSDNMKPYYGRPDVLIL